MSEGRSSGYIAPQSQDRLPLEQCVGSANRATASATTASTSSHLASPRYVQQFRALIDNQRQLFHEERELWHIERIELLEKIAQLEASVCRYRAMSSSQVSSPIETDGQGTNDWSGKDLKEVGTGDEFWRGPGGKIDARPTRTFSSSYDKSSKAQDRLAVIAQDPILHRAKAASFSITSIDSGPLRKASIRGIEVDKNLDGITFRKSSPALTITESHMTPPSPSAPRSPSSAPRPPTLASVPSLLLTATCDPYTKDAGHTPLARNSNHNLDEISSATSSEFPTPTQPEVERSPLEPRTSVAKVPSESADSYFPNAEEIRDGDAELREPLGLKNNGVQDKKFLNELDCKLTEAARSEIESHVSKSCKENVGEDTVCDQPDLEPKLRIKRSMNFGSQFGAARLGKGY